MSFEGDLPSHRGITMNGNVGWANYDDGKMVVLFYYRPVISPGKSKEAGRPIYEDVEYVRYHPPTERLNINDRPVTDEHRRRWPLQWNQFLQNKSQRPDGTPISVLYSEHPSIDAQCRASSVFTVEQLAGLEGNQVDALGMGGQRWVNDARRYLEAANKGVKGSQLRQELETRDSEIRVLNQKIEQLTAEINHMRASGPAGAGVTLDQVQALISQAQRAGGVPGRPEFPTPPPAAPNYDVSQAQINANHPTTEMAAAGNKRRKA